VLLLLVAPEGVDRIHDQGALHRGEGSDPAVAPLQLLHDEAVGDVIEPGAAILLRQVGAEQAQLGHAGNQLFGELPFYICVADDGNQVLVHPGSHGVADSSLLLGEEGVKVEEVDPGELGCAGRRRHRCLVGVEVAYWQEYNRRTSGQADNEAGPHGPAPLQRAKDNVQPGSIISNTRPFMNEEFQPPKPAGDR
jgi:hypothetical protein